MLTLITSSKTQTLETKEFTEFTTPHFIDEAELLLKYLKDYHISDLAALMKMSQKLAEQNSDRFSSYRRPESTGDGKQSLLVFQGDVYDGIDANQLGEDDLVFAQNHVCILSGLYGILRPLDLIRPYRLEMCLKWQTAEFKNLYEFWSEKVTDFINNYVEEKGHSSIVNLASNEYFKTLDKKRLLPEVITPLFKEETDKGLKTVAIYAKRARGAMVNFIIKNKITEPSQLKSFDWEGYQLNETISDHKQYIFTRKK